MNTDSTVFQGVYDHLTDEELYRFAKAEGIWGVKYIERILKYCSNKYIDVLDDLTNDLKYMCDICSETFISHSSFLIHK